jgi:O-antigen/teichoic acid export membrane protein
LLLVALLLFQAISIQNVIFINIAASLLTLILIVYLLHRHIPLSKLRLGVHPAYLRDSLQYGAKVYTSSIFTFFNYKQDRFLLNSYLSPASVGVYNIGANLGERLWLVSQSISTVLFPKIASLRGDEKQRRWMTPFITRHIFTGTAIAAVFLYWSSPFLIQLLYGSEFAAASDVLRIILPGVVFLTISRIVANDIAGRGRPGINTILAGVALVINLIANLLLISRFGIRGAAWASTISYTANAILKTIIYSHIAGVSWFSLFIIRFSDLQVWKHLIVESRRHAQPTI